MKMTVNLIDTIAGIGPQIAANGKVADDSDEFSLENYDLLAEHQLFSAMVPQSHGGGGLDYGQVAELLQVLAGYHPSTALSFSMHQHIIAANVYKDKMGQGGGPLLEKVAANELRLVSTGAGDWLASNGEMRRVEGGYRYSATKHFASGSPGANLLVTSGPFNDPEAGWQVLHFPVPTSAEGVTVLHMGGIGLGAQALTLTHEYKGGRMFYTSLGVREDFAEKNFVRMLDQALFWVAKREMPTS